MANIAAKCNAKAGQTAAETKDQTVAQGSQHGNTRNQWAEWRMHSTEEQASRPMPAQIQGQPEAKFVRPLRLPADQAQG